MRTVATPSRPSTAHRILAVALSGLALSGVGCVGGRPKAEFEISGALEPRAASYKVIYIGEDDRDRSKLSEKRLTEVQGLDTLRDALVSEAKERGYLVTSNARDADIDAYMTFGYAASGQRGTRTSYNPGSSYVIKGRAYHLAPSVSTSHYAHDDQTIWIEVYDWAQLRAAGFEMGRVKPAWRGEMRKRFEGMDGLVRREAQVMAMNLLADFPVPRATGKVSRDVFEPHERALLFSPPAAARPADAGQPVASKAAK